MKMLIVDDNEVSLTLLEAALRHANHEVFMARDGAEAVDLLRSGDIRFVISDWEMPRMSGPDLCTVIRNGTLPWYVYIIMVTSHDSPRDIVEGLSAGADDFIRKPFNPAELLARVRTGERILSLETRDVAIFALARLAESRDPETGMHLERVRSYSRLLAVELADDPRYRGEIDTEFISLIYLTSPLHDIGKVGIPDSVLLKSERLSDDEFAIMKTHTDIGARTLGAALSAFPGVKFLVMARDIAATHHERFDGTGYPSGLCGNEIPLCGRIVALADVYDALTSKRVYKPAFTHGITSAMIREESGKHFDPGVVDAFIRAESEFAAIRQQYAEHEKVAA